MLYIFLKNKIITDDLYKKILNDLSENNQKELFELINNNEFQNLNFIYQYTIYNKIIRFLLISQNLRFGYIKAIGVEAIMNRTNNEPD